jgi:hypothetical protein
MATATINVTEPGAGARQLRLNWPPTTDGSPRGPSFRQREFFRSMAREQLYGGSKRGGKTVAGCAKGIYLSYLYPGNKGYMLRSEKTDLEESTLTTFFQICPPSLIAGHLKSKRSIYLYTTRKGVLSTIIYSGMGEDSEFSDKSKEKAKSKECGWFHIDEPSEVSFDAYRMLIAQLCWFLPDGSRTPYMALLTSNPEPGWVKDRFVDETSKDYILNRSNVSAEWIPSLPRDNPGLPPGWEEDMRISENEEWIKRYLDGSWEIHEGMVFDELREHVHNLDNYVSDEDYQAFCDKLRKFGSLDHATTGITCYEVMGTDPFLNYYCVDEHYEANKLIQYHAGHVRRIQIRHDPIEYSLIDPSCENKTMQGRDELISVQDKYIEYGVPLVAANRALISVGLDQIKTLLTVNKKHKHPFTSEMGAPRLFISKSRCPNLWKELQSLKKELNKRGEIVYKGRDHAIDNVRYILGSRPGAAEQEKIDIQALPTVERVAYVAMKQFDKKFGKNQGSNNWFK